MWLAGILIINTLTMLTIALTPIAGNCKPTLKDDERAFRYGFCDFKMNAKMILTNNQPYKLSYTLKQR